MKYLLDGQETERLSFKLVEKVYYDKWMELFKESDAVKFLGLQKFKTPQQCCDEWFRKVEERKINDLGGLNALIDKKTGKLVGQCGLLIQEVDGAEELEIGYSILPAFRRMGYAIEAAQKCRDYAFTNIFRDSLISIIHKDNFRSEGVALKNKMKLHKTTKFKESPVKIYRIYKHEWEAPR
ncbi:MAG: GNAT family N-acetyltransferase [Bacteroidales bacterium]|nr:GNAT family N-acetyltransferase [Bacteroidales bacterium]